MPPTKTCYLAPPRSGPDVVSESHMLLLRPIAGPVMDPTGEGSPVGHFHADDTSSSCNTLRGLPFEPTIQPSERLNLFIHGERISRLITKYLYHSVRSLCFMEDFLMGIKINFKLIRSSGLKAYLGPGKGSTFSPLVYLSRSSQDLVSLSCYIGFMSRKMMSVNPYLCEISLKERELFFDEGRNGLCMRLLPLKARRFPSSSYRDGLDVGGD
ncbi:hypothetical protein VNO77_19866 [Canavalia gladiata]|uniref:Uncharacterized protein n=1 Tax=Canavalia gladiata TaxID=3824 RepID=A0AAN9QKW5_CANGL